MSFRLVRSSTKITPKLKTPLFSINWFLIMNSRCTYLGAPKGKLVLRSISSEDHRWEIPKPTNFEVNVSSRRTFKDLINGYYLMPYITHIHNHVHANIL